MVKKGIEMFWQSKEVEAKVNNFAARVAEFEGGLHRDADTAFLGFNVETDNRGETYVCALYEADGFKIAVWWDGAWLIEDSNWHSVTMPA